MHKDPFVGKCIHGEDGARIKGGRLTNPNCTRCKEQGMAG